MADPADRPSSERSDRDLAIAARAGGRDAFDAVVARHGPRILRFLRRMVGRAEDAQDLFQDVFLRAYRGIGRLEDPDRLRGWLSTIAVHVTRRHFERRGARPAEEPWDDSAPPPRTAGPGSDGPSGEGLAALEASERRRRVRDAILRLPPRQKAVLSLRLDLALPFQEIAEVLRIREENARAHHYQALRSLRRMLTPAPAVRGPGEPR